MAREIVQEDIVRVRALTKKVLGTEEYTEFARMGGLTNHTYRIRLKDGAEYVVRIPGLGTEELINRKDEMVSTKLACQLGVDAELLYFDESGAKVTRYIPDAITMSAELLHEPAHIRQVAQVLRKMHTCGEDTHVPFEVFEMAEGYEKIIRDKQVPMFEDYACIKEEVMDIKREVDAAVEIRKVPCHNDPLCENWVEGQGRMYLIDWEYAGMNDGMWDLGDVSIEAGYDADCDRLLLQAYLGRDPDVAEEKHFLASKIYVDYLWTLWAKARVPYDGQPMEDWAVERYTRLKNFIQIYHKL